MRCDEIIRILEELSPRRYAESWDNVGLLAGRRDKEVERVYIGLDATDDVISHAVSVDADMLLTHHPLIFSPLKRINGDDFIGKRLLTLIQNDISYFAMHTNFDVMGMADAAADELNLQERKVLEATFQDEIAMEGFGRFGSLPREMSLQECCEYVKKCFDLSFVRVCGDPEQAVRYAAVMPGSGKSSIDAAIEWNADVLVTGDIGHHEGIDAAARGLSVIDAGHYGIEKLFIAYMEEFFNREVSGVEVFAERILDPFRIV